MPKPPGTTWYGKVAETMVRQHVGFRHACNDTMIDLTGDEALRIERAKAFRDVLTAEQYRYYFELVNDPRRSKTSTIGEMLECARALVREGAFDKAIEAFFKICRVEGWVGGDSNVNVFANLTQKELDEAKKALQQKPAPIEAPTGAPLG